MDLVLRICDDHFLDNLWARLVPLSGYPSPDLAGSPPNIGPNFAPIPVSSTWSQIVSHLPPSLRQNASLFTAAANPHSLARVSAWPRDYVPRQLISLCAITLVGIHVLYFLFAWLSYKFIFNHEMMKHPRFLKNQVKLEIQASLSAFPAMMLLTLPWFQAEVMGYSKVYDGLDTYGYFYLFASVPLCVSPSHSHTYHKLTLFLVTCSSPTTVSIGCTDGFISPSSTSTSTSHITNGSVRFNTSTLWVTANQVTPLVPTPFASHAFHPLDGYMQSIPYHLFIFIFPIHRLVYLVLFVLVNMWSIFVNTFSLTPWMVLTSRFWLAC